MGLTALNWKTVKIDFEDDDQGVQITMQIVQRLLQRPFQKSSWLCLFPVQRLLQRPVQKYTDPGCVIYCQLKT